MVPIRKILPLLMQVKIITTITLIENKLLTSFIKKTSNKTNARKYSEPTKTEGLRKTDKFLLNILF